MARIEVLKWWNRAVWGKVIVCIRAGQCDSFVIEVRNVWLRYLVRIKEVRWRLLSDPAACIYGIWCQLCKRPISQQHWHPKKGLQTENGKAPKMKRMTTNDCFSWKIPKNVFKINMMLTKFMHWFAVQMH